MIPADDTPWRGKPAGLIEGLRRTYMAMTPARLPVELKRLAERLDEPPPRTRRDGKVALVAQADGDGRALATALLEESDFQVIECASAEATLAVLVNEAENTSFLLADVDLAGERDAESLTRVVRVLWPDVHVAVASLEEAERPCIDADGVTRLSRPWRGLDVLIEAERALARAA